MYVKRESVTFRLFGKMEMGLEKPKLTQGIYLPLSMTRSMVDNPGEDAKFVSGGDVCESKSTEWLWYCIVR